MKILVTNDDGIRSEGIRLLAETAREFGETIVIGPSVQNSAKSHGITLNEPMKFEEYDIGIEGVKAYSLDGRPADCVRASYLGLFDGEKLPDIVFSGVNDGANCGFDIQYSGTVGAAMEAVSQGAQAICFSQMHGEHDDVLRKYIKELAAEFINKKAPEGSVWNINFPSCSIDNYKGILYDRFPAHEAFFVDHYVKKTSPDGGLYVDMESHTVTEAEEGSDIRAILDGYISVGSVRNNVL